jgi:hypothetical protein
VGSSVSNIPSDYRLNSDSEQKNSDFRLKWIGSGEGIEDDWVALDSFFERNTTREAPSVLIC